MATGLRKGDAVQWASSQGTVSGTVQKTLTAPMQIRGHHVAASKENPEVLVKSGKTGALAAHKPASVKKVSAPKPSATATSARSAARKAAPAKR